MNSTNAVNIKAKKKKTFQQPSKMNGKHNKKRVKKNLLSVYFFLV